MDYFSLDRVLMFQTLSERPKGCTISSCCFLGNDTKKGFLTNWDRDDNTQGVDKYRKFWKDFTIR